jgi:hypothetical protein
MRNFREDRGKGCPIVDGQRMEVAFLRHGGRPLERSISSVYLSCFTPHRCIRQSARPILGALRN